MGYGPLLWQQLKGLGKKRLSGGPERVLPFERRPVVEKAFLENNTTLSCYKRPFLEREKRDFQIEGQDLYSLVSCATCTLPDKTNSTVTPCFFPKHNPSPCKPSLTCPHCNIALSKRDGYSPASAVGKGYYDKGVQLEEVRL